MSILSRTTRFVMIGGFLGAGKTTTMASLARQYRDQGLTVGIVTNDQASDLVDTQSLRAQGFEVGEVAGACFCCKFGDLIETMQNLKLEAAPDVILAEPVGSCTDLVATVIQPLRQFHGTSVTVAPYAVILKPNQGRKILRGEAGTGFSPKAAYILEKQLEEADVILINRADELTAEEIQELHELLKAKCPQTPRLVISAKTGQGFAELREFLELPGEFGQRVLDIDYEIYAEGEAELGWLNATLTLNSEVAFSLDEVLVEIIDGLREAFQEEQLEAAHLKAIGLWEGFFGVANLVSTTLTAELSLPSNCQVKTADLVVNARVACDPDVLKRLVLIVVAQVANRRGVEATEGQMQAFRPGRPVPTHRLTAPAI